MFRTALLSLLCLFVLTTTAQAGKPIITIEDGAVAGRKDIKIVTKNAAPLARVCIQCTKSMYDAIESNVTLKSVSGSNDDTNWEVMPRKQGAKDYYICIQTKDLSEDRASDIEFVLNVTKADKLKAKLDGSGKWQYDSWNAGPEEWQWEEGGTSGKKINYVAFAATPTVGEWGLIATSVAMAMAGVVVLLKR